MKKIIILIFILTFASNAQFIEEGIPEGFENLPKSESTLIDVYFNNKLRGSVKAEFSFEEGWVVLESPQLVVNKIQELKQPDIVLETLSQKLASNENRICEGDVNETCGFIEPSIAAIIFNPSNFRMDLFINPLYLKPFGNQGPRYLQDPPDSFNTLTQINIGANKSDNEETNKQAIVNEIISKGKHRLKANFIYNSQFEQKSGIDDILYENEGKKWKHRFGYFNTKSFSFLNQYETLGYSFESNLDTRTDLNQSRGTPITIYLTRTSQVIIKRKDFIVLSRLFNPGYHIIDTSSFPEGSYYIDILINEYGGVSRQERKLFTRLNRFPPLGPGLIQIDAGMKQKIKEREEISTLEVSDSPVIAGIFSKRILDNLSLHTGFGIEESRSSLIFGYLFPYNIMNNLGENGIDFLVSSDTSKGFRFSNLFRLGNFDINLGSTILTQDELPNENTNFYLETYRPTTQLFSKVGWLYKRFRTVFGYDYSKTKVNSSLIKREVLSLNNTYPAKFMRNLFVTLNLNVSNINQDEWVFLFTINSDFRRREKPRVFARYSYQSENEPSEEKEVLRSYEVGTGYNKNINNFKTASNLRFREEESKGTVAFDSLIRSPHGSTDLNLSRSTSNSEEQNLSLRFQGAIASHKKDFAFGGERPNQSGVIISVENSSNVESKNSNLFKVFVNNSHHSTIPAGKKYFIPLSPYESYKIRIKETEDFLANFDNSPKSITLYPGTIERLNWDIQRIVVIVTKIVLPGGNPLSNSRAQLINNIAETDDEGFLQAEIPINLKKLVFNADTEDECEVQLPGLTNDQQIFSLDDLTCL
jgi:hypothetical protein